MIEKTNDLFHTTFENKTESPYESRDVDNISLASESHLSSTSNNLKKTFRESTASLAGKSQA